MLTGARKARAEATPLMGELRRAVGLRSLTTLPTSAHKSKAPKVAAPSFKQYRESDGAFYVKLLAADGRLLLQSTGFVQPQQAAQLVALLKNGFAVHTLPTTVSLADGVGLADVATALAFFEIGKSNAEH